MVKCNECGYENMDGLDYCDGCGAKLSAAAPAGGQSAPAPEAAAAEPPHAGEPSAAPAPETAGEKASEAPTGEIAEKAGAAAPSVAEPPPVAGALTAKLIVVRGGRKSHEFPLEEGNNMIGRWDPETGAFPEVDLDQDDPEAKVSRKHALVRFENGKITVEDVGSLNGTYVNRQPRLQPGNPFELKSGDEIIIGKTFLKVSIEPVS